MPNLTLLRSSHRSFRWLQSVADHTVGGNFMPASLRYKKSFLRLLHFMGGNIIWCPLSPAWLHFKSCAGCGVSEMHAGCTRQDVLHLFSSEVTRSLQISCRLIAGSVYLFVHTVTWPIPYFSGGAGLLLCNRLPNIKEDIWSCDALILVVKASRNGGRANCLNCWKWLHTAVQFYTTLLHGCPGFS